jgi:ketosteroid isomerase-like protein
MSELTELVDKQQITEVVYRYAVAVDTRDWDLLRSCFTPDAKADYLDLPACPSYAEIESTCRNALTPLTATQHLLGNVLVELHGDTADCQCYLQAQHVMTGAPGGDLFVIAGKYTDRFERTADGWRIGYRRLDLIWADGNPAVVGG